MATRVTITKALEAKLRKGEGLAELINRLDEAQRKRETGSNEQGPPGLGYKELVSLFRSYLGDALVTPPKPNPTYIVKIVNRAKEQGIDYTNVEQIIKGLLLGGRSSGGTYRLGDIIYNADTLFQRGGVSPVSADSEGGADSPRHLRRVVRTGREALEEESD